MTEPTTQRLDPFHWVERIGRSQRIGLLSGALLLAALWVGTVGIYRPWAQNRSRLTEQIREEEERAELLSTIATQRGQLLDQQKKVLLPGGASGLTSEVSRLASQTGMQIESVAPQPQLSFGPYTQFQIQVVASTTTRQLLQFLRLLENHGSFLRVDQCEVGTPPIPGGSGTERGPIPLQESNPQRVALWISAFLRREGET